MVKKIEWKPERLDENTTRVRVLGGWMLVTVVTTNKGIASTSLFVADQHWEWLILEPMVDPKVVRANIAKEFKAE